MNKKDEEKMLKDLGIDLESFHRHGLTLVPVDTDGTLRVVKL